jgi:hypothetical protein
VARFLMVARDDNAAFASPGPAEAQAVIQKCITWSNGLREGGSLEIREIEELGQVAPPQSPGALLVRSSDSSGSSSDSKTPC